MKFLANLYAQDFLVPQPDATVVVRDPYGDGLTPLAVLDIVRYLKRAPDAVVPTPAYGIGRVFSIDYGLDSRLITLKVG